MFHRSADHPPIVNQDRQSSTESTWGGDAQPGLALERVEDLFDGTASAMDVAGSRWWVLYTRSRQEKMIADRLASRHIPCYLPLVERVTTSGKRRFKFQIPVFSNYVFLFGGDEERQFSLETNRVSRILPVDDQHRLFSDLRNLWNLIRSGEQVTIESRLAPGQQVRIRRGPLEGIVGTIIKRRGKTRLLVSVDFMNQGASIAIEDHLVERHDAARRQGVGGPVHD